MADDQDSGTAAEGVKKLELRKRPRVSVATSLGTLYARHLTVGDLKAFSRYFDKDIQKDSADLKALGELALKAFVCADEGPERTPALTDESFQRLNANDFEVLSAAVAGACGLTLPAGEPLEALGSALFDRLSKHAKDLAEIAAKAKQSLESTFGSLPEHTRNALGDTLKGLSAIRESLKGSTAMEALRKAQEEQKRALGSISAIQHHLKTSGVGETFRRAQEANERRTAGISESMREHLGRPALSGISISQLPEPPIFQLPSYEDTPAGQTAKRAASASEESARQLQEVAGLVGEMSEQVEKMQTVFLTEVLPHWFKNLEEGAKTTNTTLSQAEKSLFWAKWALIASVVVTILATTWQVWIAREYKLEDDKQQNAMEFLLRQQLTATQELNKQLAADSKQLRDELAKLRQAEKHTPRLTSGEHASPKSK